MNLSASKPADPDGCRNDRYQAARLLHSGCMVCGEPERNRHSLGLQFVQQADGSVTAVHCPDATQQGYAGLTHGGMISTLLDAAMTHCLFAHGIRALTAEIIVRFVAPVRTHHQVKVTARLLGQRRRTYRLEARMMHGPQLLARATARFIDAGSNYDFLSNSGRGNSVPTGSQATASVRTRTTKEALEPTPEENVVPPIRIAVPLVDGLVASHFGHCERMAFFDVGEDGLTVDCRRDLTPPLHVPGQYPKWLSDESVKVVVARAMGARAQDLFMDYGIDMVLGTLGDDPDLVVRQYFEGRLATDEPGCGRHRHC